MKSIQIKLILSALSIILISSTLSGYIIYNRYRQSLDSSIIERLRYAVEAADSAYDFSRVRTLFEPGGEESSYHLNGVDKMIELKEKFNVEYLYGLIKNTQGEWVYIFDNSYYEYEDGEDPFLYPLDVEWVTLDKAIETKEIQFDQEYYTDEWGTFISVAKPLLDKSGNVYMILGADLEASYIDTLKRQTLFLLITAVMVSTLIATIAAFFLSRRFVQPIKYLVESLRDMSEGHGDLSKRMELRSKDEIGNMIRYYNLFLDSMTNLINRIKSTSVDNISIKNDLNDHIKAAAFSLEELLKGIVDTNANMDSMEKTINESSLSVKAIITNLEELNSLIEDQASASEESTASVTQMVASLKNIASIVEKKEEATKILVNRSRDGRNNLNNTSELFRESIAARINNISEMTTIIANIASQTNLLSMNAAIEAAHAGDSGKGFAVVADEIRKLAEVSSTNSKEISKTIKEIVGAIEKTSNNFSATSSSFEVIEEEVVGVDDALKEINSATRELSQGGEQILSAMSLLNDSTEKVRTQSGEINALVESAQEADNMSKSISSEVRISLTNASTRTGELKSDIENTLASTERLDVSSEKIDSEVNKFKTD